MAEEFRSLAAALRERSSPGPGGDVPRDVAPIERIAPADVGARSPFVDEAVRARLALEDSYARAMSSLLERLATDVLARELALAPASIAALAERLWREYAAAEPVRLRVAPGDDAEIATALPMVIDPSLASGDCVLEVRDGTIDASFAVRAADAVERALG